MDKQPTNGILEEFRLDFLDCWQRLPNKGFFFTLLAVWLALFSFLGNSTLGYINSPSLLRWMYNAYHPGGDNAVSEDAHGLLVPLVVVVLFWLKRKRLLALPLEIWWPSLVLIGMGLALHVVGYVGQQARISIVGLFTGIYGLMGLAWGPAFLRASFFPFFLFVFCVPLGSLAQPITFRLRVFVCQLVVGVSHYLLGVDIIRDGTILRDPSGQYQYEVAAACSGLRSLIATLAIGTIYGFLSFRSWWKRGVLIASAIPMAVLGNLIRMMTIVIASEIGGARAGNYVHEGGPLGIFSLLPYIPAFAGLLLLGHWLREPQLEPPLPLQPSMV